MSEPTPIELERDAERVRAELSDTAEQLKNKMSPRQLMDEVVNYFKDGDTNELLNNLKHQVRDNPLALAVIGGGLAWLMMGNGPSSDRHSKAPRTRPHSASGAPVQHATESPPRRENASAASGTTGSLIGMSADGVKSATKEAAHGLSEAASAGTDAVSSGMHDLRDATARGVDYATDTGAELGARAKSTFLEALEREPLVIGALGVAVGAAVGAMLPATSIERGYMGSASAKARDKAESMVAGGVDKAKHVASDVYSAAREEADNQGLTSSDRPLTAKAAHVARAAGAELRAAADSATEEVEEALEDTTDRLTSKNLKP
jgi:hypothetical protein